MRHLCAHLFAEAIDRADFVIVLKKLAARSAPHVRAQPSRKQTPATGRSASSHRCNGKRSRAPYCLADEGADSRLILGLPRDAYGSPHGALGQATSGTLVVISGACTLQTPHRLRTHGQSLRGALPMCARDALMPIGSCQGDWCP